MDEPSYDDVAAEEKVWDMSDIIRLQQSGLNRSEIARALKITPSTTSVYLRKNQSPAPTKDCIDLRHAHE